MSLTIAERSVTHSTFVIERTYKAAPGRVFAALADPSKKRRWFAESENHAVEEFSMDFRVGGAEHSRFRVTQGGPFADATFTAVGTYLDIVPDSRVVIASTMALSGRRFSASLTTFELLPTEAETTLIFTHQGAFFEGADGPKMREAGWRKLLENLAQELASQAA